MNWNAEEIWNLLFHVTEQLRDCNIRRQAESAPQELTLPQQRIISCVLMARPRSVRLKDLALELGLTPGAVSQSVDQLVRKKILERNPDPDDRRAIAISIAPEGLHVQGEIGNSITHMMQELLQGIPREKLSHFQDVLKDLCRALNHQKELYEK